MNWTKSEIEYLKENFSSSNDKSLSIFLRKSPNAIRIKASRSKLNKQSTIYRNSLKLTPNEEQIILGGLMGDLHCRLTYTSKNPRLEGGHGHLQLEYLKYKLNILNRLKWVIRDGPDRVQHYESKSFSSLNKYYHLFYSSGRKSVNREALDKIEPLGLLIWYLDDGSYHKRDKISRIYTNCFTYEEHLIIKEWFEQKFRISPTIYKFKDKKGKMVYYLNFSVSETKKLHNLLVNFEIPECMKYKLYYNHKITFTKIHP